MLRLWARFNTRDRIHSNGNANSGGMFRAYCYSHATHKRAEHGNCTVGKYGDISTYHCCADFGKSNECAANEGSSSYCNYGFNRGSCEELQ